MPSNSQEVQQALRLTLPDAYCTLLDCPPAFISDEGLSCYLWSHSTVVRENRAYVLNPEDISDIEGSTLVSKLKRLLVHGSKAKIVAYRKKYRQRWVEPRRFMIGNDGGEDIFFIQLDDPNCAVWAYDLETGHVALRFQTIAAYQGYVESIEDGA
jgi:hypothetical protein